MVGRKKGLALSSLHSCLGGAMPHAMLPVVGVAPLMGPGLGRAALLSWSQCGTSFRISEMTISGTSLVAQELRLCSQCMGPGFNHWSGS